MSGLDKWAMKKEVKDKYKETEKNRKKINKDNDQDHNLNAAQKL